MSEDTIISWPDHHWKSKTRSVSSPLEPSLVQILREPFAKAAIYVSSGLSLTFINESSSQKCKLELMEYAECTFFIEPSAENTVVSHWNLVVRCRNIFQIISIQWKLCNRKRIISRNSSIFLTMNFQFLLVIKLSPGMSKSTLQESVPPTNKLTE